MGEINKIVSRHSEHFSGCFDNGTRKEIPPHIARDAKSF